MAKISVYWFQVESQMKIMKNNDINKNNNSFKLSDYKYFDEKIVIQDIDYYHSNAIARASKTMTECKNIKLNYNKTGTEG